MRKYFLAASLALGLFSPGLDAQTPAQIADLERAEALVLTFQLTGDAKRDAAILQSTGLDHAAQILTALLTRGMNLTASAQDWTGLHRAVDALIELEVFRGDFAKAANYACTFNAYYYRTHEHDYVAALRSGQQALELQQSSGQIGTSFLIYQSIGKDLVALGRIDDALVSYRLAQALIPLPNGKHAALLREDIVQAFLARHDIVSANKECAEIDRIAEAAPPIFKAYAQITRSMLLFERGDYRAAVQAIKLARSTAVAKDEDELLAQDANAKVMNGAIDGLYRLPYEEALALAVLLEKDLPGMPVPVNVYANLVVAQRRRLAGDIDGLLREDARRAEEARAAGNVFGQIEALQSMAASYSAMNGVRQQKVMLEEALRLTKTLLPANGIPDNAASQSSYLRTLDSLGDAYLELRNPEAAERCFKEVVKLLASFDPAARNRLKGLNVLAALGLARVLELDDRPDDARDALLRILHDENAAKNGFDKTDLLLQLARLERSLDEKPAMAVAYYEQAIAGYRESRSLNQELAARLALTRYLTGKAAKRIVEARAKAEEHLLAVQRALPQLTYAEDEWRLYFLRGILAEDSQSENAIDYYRQSIRKLEAIRAGLTQQEHRQGLLDNEAAQELYSRLIALLTRTGKHDEAWQYLERSKARSFIEMLQGRRFSNGSDRPMLAELKKLESQIANLQLQLKPQNAEFQRSLGRETGGIIAELDDVKARYEVSWQHARLEQDRAGQVLSSVPPTLSAIQKRIPKQTAVIEYGLLDGAITAFVLTESHFEQITWKVDLNGLNRDVNRLRLLLENGSADGLDPLIVRISSALIEPVSGAVPPGTLHLVIIPAGYLNYLPFSMLRLPDGRALIDVVSTSNLPSASALLYLTNPKASGDGLFLGAIGNQTPAGLAPLPASLAEAAGIAKVYSHAEVRTGAKFTHDEARRALLQYDRVHFATHGEIDEKTPLFSALVTSPAAGQPSRLSLFEITELSLKADMVVMSACKTATGKLLGGDELNGLTRTFLTAGANTVISSLWSVDDVSTAVLMEEFYRNLRDGLTPSQALRKSAIAVRAEHPHPSHWASFLVTGVQ